MQIDQALDRPQGIPHLYRELWRYAAGARGVLLGAFALLVGSQLFKLAVPWLAGVFAATAASWAMHGPGRVLNVGPPGDLALRSQVFHDLMSALAASPA